jgi:hypothetical protein
MYVTFALIIKRRGAYNLEMRKIMSMNTNIHNHILGINSEFANIESFAFPPPIQKCKGKGKFHPITGHESTEGGRGIALLFP